MFSNAELYTAYQIANAPVRGFPYPHCFVPNVFPPDFYAELQRNLPDPAAMIPIEEARQVKGYKERFVLELHKPEHIATLPESKREFWRNVAEWMVGGNRRQLGRFGQFMMTKFQPFVQNRLKNLSGIKFYDEAYLVEDVTNYKIGPHSDTPVKVITMLFYLPKDDVAGASRHLDLPSQGPELPVRRRTALSVRVVQPRHHHAVPAELAVHVREDRQLVPRRRAGARCRLQALAAAVRRLHGAGADPAAAGLARVGATGADGCARNGTDGCACARSEVHVLKARGAKLFNEARCSKRRPQTPEEKHVDPTHIPGRRARHDRGARGLAAGRPRRPPIRPSSSATRRWCAASRSCRAPRTRR